MTTKNGKCRDCAQGIIGKAHAGFEQYIEEGEALWWFCRYCGSNHVDIHDSEGGILIEQGDNYQCLDTVSDTTKNCRRAFKTADLEMRELEERSNEPEWWDDDGGDAVQRAAQFRD